VRDILVSPMQRSAVRISNRAFHIYYKNIRHLPTLHIFPANLLTRLYQFSFGHDWPADSVLCLIFIRIFSAIGLGILTACLYASELLGFWPLSIVRYSKKNIKGTQRVGNWICFRPQVKGWEIHTLLGPSIRKWLRVALSNGPNRVGISHPFTWGRKQIQFPTRCVPSVLFLEHRTMDKVQKPGNSECYTASSEPFRIYMFICI
jgi:hypothetical protein